MNSIEQRSNPRPRHADSGSGRIRSELGVVVAHLAPDFHLRHAEDDVAVRVGHRFQLEHPEDGHLPGQPGAGVQRHRAGLHVLDQLRELGAEAAGQHGHLQLHGAVALAGDAAGVDAGDAHQDAAVPELRGPRRVREGRRVGVVHVHGEEHGEVELEPGAVPRDEADDPRRDEPRGGVADAEHGEEEDQERDAQEQGGAQGDEEAHAGAAAPAPAELVGVLVLGVRRRVRGVRGENGGAGVHRDGRTWRCQRRGARAPSGRAGRNGRGSDGWMDGIANLRCVWKAREGVFNKAGLVVF